jgi:hypothetical protein
MPANKVDLKYCSPVKAVVPGRLWGLAGLGAGDQTGDVYTLS